MDPQACLMRALAALNAGDVNEALAALNDYDAWRKRGGFEPTITTAASGMQDTPGDEFVVRLLPWLMIARSTFSSTEHADADTCCSIRWIDHQNKPTPDSHRAIGRVRRKQYSEWLHGSFLQFEATEWTPICVEHALQINTLQFAKWEFRPFALPQG